MSVYMIGKNKEMLLKTNELSLNALKIINILLWLEGKQFALFSEEGITSVDFKTLRNKMLLGNSNKYAEILKKALNELNKHSFFSVFKINKNKNRITLVYALSVEDGSQDDNKILIDIEKVVNFKSKYALRFYEFLKVWEVDEKKNIEYELLKNILGLKNKKGFSENSKIRGLIKKIIPEVQENTEYKEISFKNLKGDLKDKLLIRVKEEILEDNDIQKWAKSMSVL